MSGYRKGTRKPKSLTLRDINIGGLKIPPALAVSALLAALYALFLFGSQFGTGSDSLLLSAFSVLSFAAFAYLARTGSLAGLRPFAGLIDAFLALSALTFIWDIATFFNVTASLTGLMKPVSMSIAFAALTILLIGLLLFYEKGKLEDIFVKAGSSMSMLSGIAGLIICVLLSIVGLYFLFGGSSMGLDNVAYLSGLILLFSVLAAAYEEVWFRGLLLSRMLPLVGERTANVIQSLAFGVFEAFAIYAISPQLIYLPAVFIIGSILGYYWGRMTIKDDSIVGAALFHAGFYALIGLPLFAGML